MRNTVEALPVILRKDAVELFSKYKVYSERELNSRYNILCEGYVKTVNVEARLTALMANTMVIPAALRYQGEVAMSVNATKAAGIDNGAQMDLLRTLTTAISTLQKASADLEHALGHHADGDAYAHAKHMRDAVIPAMNAARAAGDRLEGLVSDEHWPLPTYREMLFIK